MITAATNRSHFYREQLQQSSISSSTKVSAVIITYNEEKNLRRTLDALYWCDEIIIIDSHSTDNTVAIAKEYGCNVYSRAFDGYGSQKRFAVSKAGNDWVLCIDADEVLAEELVEEIQDALSRDTVDCAGFSMPMNLVFLDKEFKYGKESGRHYLRLFNRKKGGFTEDKVHERIQVYGQVVKLGQTIKHYSYTSLQQCLEKCNRYSSYSAEMAFNKGKKKSVLAVVFGFPYNFLKYYFLERNFLNGIQGFYWSVFASYYHFVKYVKLRELHRTSQKPVLKNDQQFLVALTPAVNRVNVS